jgi:hypothetical protein
MAGPDDIGFAVGSPGQKDPMQAVVETLTEHGIEGSEVQEDGYVAVAVPCGKDDTRDCQELIADIESWLAEKGLPFVPEEIDGRVVIRPPAT